MEDMDYIKSITKVFILTGILLGVMYYASTDLLINEINTKLSTLFGPVFMFWALGFSFYFLLRNMNQKFASVMITITLPVSGIITLFGSWLPEVSELAQTNRPLSLFSIIFVAFMLTYFGINYHYYISEVKN